MQFLKNIRIPFVESCIQFWCKQMTKSSTSPAVWSLSRYLQYDDWFYPIAGKGYGATVTWDAMPSVFPDGLKYENPIHSILFTHLMSSLGTCTIRHSSLSWLTIVTGKAMKLIFQWRMRGRENGEFKVPLIGCNVLSGVVFVCWHCVLPPTAGTWIHNCHSGMNSVSSHVKRLGCKDEREK